MRAAVVQINSTADRDSNLERAARHVAAAAKDGAELIVLPEKWNLLGGVEVMLEGAEAIDGTSIKACQEWAREHGVHIVAGSFAERIKGADRLSNTSILVGPDGKHLAAYRKIHMFDVEVGGVTYSESDIEQPGNEIVVGAVEDITVGLSVCYDLRFPELFRILALQGATVITLPSAFTLRTGKDHWEVLIRARAIENQLFMLASGQIGKAPPQYESFGRSMIVDPWGVVLATASDGEGYAVANLDFERLNQVRTGVPSLANRMPATYNWPTEQVASPAAGSSTRTDPKFNSEASS